MKHSILLSDKDRDEVLRLVAEATALQDQYRKKQCEIDAMLDSVAKMQKDANALLGQAEAILERADRIQRGIHHEAN